MPLTGVAGWPIAHSRSPALHEAAFADLGLTDWFSQLLPITPELFDETIAALEQSGFAGVNVTIPHKEAALRIASDASTEARAIGAANTLTFSNGHIQADNTDAPAIQDAMLDLLERRDLSGLSVAVMGAGGSARAAAFAAVRAGADRTLVWNRNRSRAESLVASLHGVEAVDEIGSAEVLVNATPVGLTEGLGLGDLQLQSGLPADLLAVIDLVYSDSGPTDLIELAVEQEILTLDGLEILALQGARAVEIWTGRRPSLSALRAAVAADQ